MVRILKIDERRGSGTLVLYHGTKARFDRFDPKYVDSGWGEQAYGYGFYLTDNREAAEQYSRGGVVMEVEVPDGKWLSYDGIRKSEASAIARKFFGYYTKEDGYGKEAYPDQESRREFWDSECRYICDCDDGGDIYGTLASLLGSDEDTSRFLRGLGYIGIKFPASNGETGEKFTNYVVFDANDITVR